MKTKVFFNSEFKIGNPDKMIFSSFIEHLGRAIYSGIYEPENEKADKDGFRTDVTCLIKELGVSGIRYPGGNFVSGYNWKDGIGDKSKRPEMTDLAWNSLEPNLVGTDEFLTYCRKIGCEPIMAVNLGTGSITDAKELLEYCNIEKGTKYSNLRIENGYKNPHNVKYWCLGNEMDGPWQIGHKTAYEYGRLANETAKIMRLVDSDIKLVACGSSSETMKTFPEWEDTVLSECYDNVDYISLHRYFSNADNDTASFLASGYVTDRYISQTLSACDYVKSKKRSKKTMMLSFDEYNVWYHSNAVKSKKFEFAPSILEDIYNIEDAVCVGGILISLLRHCDRVKIACLAQLVNVIAPIMTVKGGGAWKQTIFYPFKAFTELNNSTVLNVSEETETYVCRKYGEIPVTDSIGAIKPDGEGVIFVVNRSTEKAVDYEVSLENVKYTKALHSEISGELKAENSYENPYNVVMKTVKKPVIEDGILKTTLSPASFNVIKLR